MAPLSGLRYATMTTDLTNLLPRDRRRSLARDYLFRVLVVVLWLLTVLVIIHGLLLLPSYLYVNQQIQARETQLATLELAASGATQQELKSRISALETRAKLLAALGTQGAASSAMRAVLAAPRPGIRLHGFTYAPSTKPEENKMTLNGIAATRESLRQYLGVLDTLPYVTKAELPISAYAKERDIAFTITLTGTLIP